MDDPTRDPERRKKPYVRPELASATVYEASGKTCCKVTAATCGNTPKGAIGKDAATANAS